MVVRLFLAPDLALVEAWVLVFFGVMGLVLILVGSMELLAIFAILSSSKNKNLNFLGFFASVAIVCTFVGVFIPPRTDVILL